MTDEVLYRKSSHCPNGDCVEVAELPDGNVSIRDSKAPEQAALIFTHAEWDAFRLGILNGEFSFRKAAVLTAVG